MPHLLPDFPEEVLALITSVYQDLSSILRLHSCGNRLLTTKLINGGVIALRLKTSKPKPGVLSLVESFRLSSVTLDETLSTTSLKAFVYALPPTLRSLKVNHKESSLLWLLDENYRTRVPFCRPSPLDISLAHIMPHYPALWSIRDSFPSLEVLHFTKGSAGGGFNVIDACIIVSGLPLTLTDLSLMPRVGFDIYGLLPPNLQRLGSSTDQGSLKVIPTQNRQNRLSSLTTLSLDLERAPTTKKLDVSSHNPPFWDKLGSWKPQFIEDLWFPPTLTQLHLNYRRDQKEYFKRLPASLLTLSLRPTPENVTDDEVLTEDSILTILSFVPLSVTDLTLDYGLHFASEFNLAVALNEVSVADVKPLINVKRFSISFANDRLKIGPQLLDLIRSIPNVEHFSMRGKEAQHSLMNAEAVKAFDGARLRSLEALFHLDCLPLGELPSPLSSLSVLQRLHIDNSTGARSDFNFSWIPPSVTHFSMNSVTTTKLLHLLPLSVTRLQIPNIPPLLVTGEYFKYLSKSQASPSSSHGGDSNGIEEIVFGGLNAQRLELPEEAELYAPSHFTASPSSLGPSPPSLGRFKLQWPESFPRLVLPETLTEMRNVPFQFWFKPDRTLYHLPSLTKLVVKNRFARFPFDFSRFPKLIDLEITLFDLANSGSCPPNLTRLIVDHDLPRTYHPLPISITELAYMNPLLEHIAHLPRLQKLSSETCITWNHSDYPATLTSLTSWVPNWSIGEWHLFFSRIPGLKGLTLRGPLNQPGLEYVYDAKPSHVIIHDQLKDAPFKTDPAALLDRANVDLGSLTLPKGLMVETAAIQLAKRAYPSSHREEIIFDKTSSADPSWALILPYLSPSTAELEIRNLSFCRIPNLAWPAGLTTLIFHTSGRSTDPLNLPPTLKKLIISDSDNNGRWILDSLPSSLTHLEIPNWKFSSGAANPWPPQLSYLSVGELEGYQTQFAAMPSSLTHLKMTVSNLNPSDYPFIPAQLEKLECPMRPTIRNEFIEFMENRTNLVWILPSDAHQSFHLSAISSVLERLISALDCIPTGDV